MHPIGYLPHEKPRTIPQLFFFAFQQLLVMMPATVTVALITGFHTSTTILASGMATIIALLVTKGKIPLYYGSSFSYLAVVVGITGVSYGEIASDETIRIAQFGILMSGFVSIAAGLIVKRAGMKVIKKILPASITGPIAAIIGLSLASIALTGAIGYDPVTSTASASSWWLAIAAILITTIFAVVLKKGVLSQLPILLGIGTTYIIAAILGFVDFSPIVSGGVIAMPHITFPKVHWGAALAIMPIAFATIPESTAHLYQLDNAANSLVKERKDKVEERRQQITNKVLRLKDISNEEAQYIQATTSGDLSDTPTPSWLQKVEISSLLWLSLIADGIGDIVAALIGGPGGTNYGENLSTMQITRVYSKHVIFVAGLLAILCGFFAPLAGLFQSIPGSVFNGVCIYLFGVIAWQGISIMHEDWKEVSSRRGISVSSVVLTFGIGGSYAFNDGIPFMGWNVPAIAFAAIFGIILNLVLLGFEKIGDRKNAD